MRERLGALTLLVALGGGCYEYVPVSQPAPYMGRRVQIVLTDAGAVALASQLGPSVESLEGTLLGDSSESYRVGVIATRLRSGSENDWRGEIVTVPHALVSSLSERRFSTSRTLFAGTLAAAGAIGATVGLRGKGESSAGSQTPGTAVGK